MIVEAEICAKSVAGTPGWSVRVRGPIPYLCLFVPARIGDDMI